MSIEGMDIDEKVHVLVRFWEESLHHSKILKKLIFKEQSTNQRLSDKEQKLK